MFLDLDNVTAMQKTLLEDCRAFLPEIILCGTVVALLLMRLVRIWDHKHLGIEALALTVIALAVSVQQWRADVTGTHPIFGGLLAYDNFTIFLRIFLFSFTALLIWLTLLTGIPDKEDSADFYCLLLGATIGMSIMASANHLLMAYIGVEMASVPSYALAGFLKGRRLSSEASLKYVVYGGGASGIMLYGISLIAGKFGTAYLPDLAHAIPLVGADPVVLLGLLFILIGLSFKLAAVPFQFWCPDVFEGAAAEVAGFLSVASKGAALALLGRIVLVLIGVGAMKADPSQPPPPPSLLVKYLAPLLALVAIATATFGNLAAYPQTNLKRLLAYSTIAHAGIMLMGLATLTATGTGAVLFYLIAYSFMNLGAFAIVAFLRNLTGSEDLKDFRGMIHRAPVLVIAFAFFLLSLLGLPPLVGFAAKFQIFSALFEAAQQYARTDVPLSNLMYATLVIAGINTVFSAVYYLRVLKVMIIERSVEMVEGKEPEPLPVSASTALYSSLLAGAVLVLGILWTHIDADSVKGVSPWAPEKSTRSVMVKPGEER